MRILLIEDETVTERSLAKVIHCAADVIDHTASVGGAFDLMRCYDYDLVLLDLVTPNVDGLELVQRMRKLRIETPVLVVSGLSGYEALVAALGKGADDFIAKPFHDAELLARIRAVIRRSKGITNPIVRVANLEIDLNSREAKVDDVPVPLTAKEYSILELLVMRKGSLLSKQYIFEHVYGNVDQPEPRIIDVFICKLRKKLRQASAVRLIDTIWGQGYRLRDLKETPPTSSKEVVV